MAHRTNVIQVSDTIRSSEPPQKVKDPVCGMEIMSNESNHLLVRGDQTYYFCSKECQRKYSASVQLGDTAEKPSVSSRPERLESGPKKKKAG